jgi:hypothetical protein
VVVHPKKEHRNPVAVAHRNPAVVAHLKKEHLNPVAVDQAVVVHLNQAVAVLLQEDSLLQVSQPEKRLPAKAALHLHAADHLLPVEVLRLPAAVPAQQAAAMQVPAQQVQVAEQQAVNQVLTVEADHQEVVVTIPLNQPGAPIQKDCSSIQALMFLQALKHRRVLPAQWKEQMLVIWMQALKQKDRGTIQIKNHQFKADGFFMQISFN